MYNSIYRMTRTLRDLRQLPPRLLVTGALIAAITASIAGPAAQTSGSLLLDDFESGLRVANPSETVLQYRNLWVQYTGDFTAGPDPGVASVVSAPVHSGSHALQVHLDPRPTDGKGNLYLTFYPNNGSWGYMHEYLLGAGWTQNTFNRLKFWMFVPSNVGQGNHVKGNHNMELGTFVKASWSNGSSSETGGGHYYHFYAMPYTGAWHQVILDWHPSHQRSGSGATEWGQRQYPTGESTWNYFDALTEFYLDMLGNLPDGGPPADFYFDSFELYRETASENLNQVYSLSAAYNPSTNRLYVGWSRPKDDPVTAYEVRYAFSSIYGLGWSNATPAPSGTIPNNGDGPYNLMYYDNNTLRVSGQSMLYVAIKPQNSSSFRQIAIPLTTSSTPARPAPPRNVRIRR